MKETTYHVQVKQRFGRCEWRAACKPYLTLAEARCWKLSEAGRRAEIMAAGIRIVRRTVTETVVR